MKFYVCEHCGNIITFVKSSGVPVMCCGQKMTEIVPGTTDAAVEKHVPVVKAEGSQVTVTVGAVEHPMLPEHFIEWIVLETQQGSQRAEPQGSALSACQKSPPARSSVVRRRRNKIKSRHFRGHVPRK